MSCLRLTNLIEKKRDGGNLDAEEIQFFVDCAKRLLPDSDANPDQLVPRPDPSQIGSMLMAIYLNGMNEDETRNLTSSMKNSGYVFSWPKEWKHLVVDKHSTGGVGDKISLVLAPALAAVGLKVPMISGRSLAHTGGTLDKLESIPGFCIEHSSGAVIKQVQEIGCCMIGQTDQINPADKIIYSIRDITATVGQPALITASIVSKKLAEGLNAIVYDVKFGKGSLFRSEEEALEMAKRLVASSSHETKSSALFTAMDIPIGYEIGNTREVLESVRSMKGEAPVDVLELVEELGSELMYMTGVEVDRTKGKEQIRAVLSNGKALEKFYKMLIYQGVSEETATTLCYREAADALPKAKFTRRMTYRGPNGYVNSIDAPVLAKFWKWIAEKSGAVDLTAGLTLLKHVGDEIRTDDEWLEIHHNCPLDEEKLNEITESIEASNKQIGTRKRVYKRIYLDRGVVKVTDKQ